MKNKKTNNWKKSLMKNKRTKNWKKSPKKNKIRRFLKMHLNLILIGINKDKTNQLKLKK